MIEQTILKELEESSSVLRNFIEQEKKHNSIAEAANLIAASLKKGGKIISCGNGGSSCDAMHFAEE